MEPVYNIAPSPGEPAAFMFTPVAFPVRLDTSVLSDGNYAVRVTASDLTEADGARLDRHDLGSSGGPRGSWSDRDSKR